MKLAIIGSREFFDYELLSDTLDSLDIPITEIVSGGALGADSLARKYAKERNLKIIEVIPSWNRGKHAGMSRNTAIVNHCDKLIAFWDGKSKGTADSIEKARKQNKLYKIVKFLEDDYD